MSEPKFTPFKVKRESKLYLPPQFLIMDEAESKQIAVVFDPKCVNLIAAAPELYEKLKEFVEHALYTIDLSAPENRVLANIVNPGIDLLQKIETP